MSKLQLGLQAYEVSDELQSPAGLNRGLDNLPAMPLTATKVGEDTRLEPHEKRTLTYEIPAKGVALVRAELYYNLLWPGLVEKFKQLPLNLTAPVLIAESEEEIAAH
jgi:hypothetical protein